MSKLMGGIALAAVMATSAWADDASKLVGVWKLTSYTRHETDTGKDIKFYGEHPTGYTIYTKGGHFVSSGFGDGRVKMAAAIPTDDERIAFIKSMWSFDGTYKVEGSKISYTIDDAWLQGWLGGHLTVDKFEVTDKTMTLVTQTFKATAGPSSNSAADIIVTTTYERME
jgi:hypothetical protein